MSSTKKTSPTGTARTQNRKGSFGTKTTESLRAVAEGAARYFRQHGRSFPWRAEKNPYKLAVAEILLQKTRAASAVDTYEYLVTKYPNAEALGKAGVGELERLLKPLGLSKKRASQLHRMASAVVENGEAVFEDWKVLLDDVPGLGAYAARAIACFGTGESVGIVDANVARILRRIFRIQTDDPRAVIYQKYADAVAAESESVRETNFGLLDIGAAICTSKPNCPACPLREYCAYGRRVN